MFEVPHGITRERYVYRLETGLRVALRTQYLARDLRWFRGLCD